MIIKHPIIKNFYFLILCSVFLLACDEVITEPVSTDWNPVGTSADISYSNMFFLDDNTGYLLGESFDSIHIATTLNLHPDAFVDFNSTDIFTDTNEYYPFSIEKISPTEPEPSLFVTIDGGKTWTGICNKVFYRPVDIQFIDKNIGFILTAYGLYKTTDGGNNWTRILINDYNYADGSIIDIIKPFKAFHFFNENEGIAYSREEWPLQINIHTKDGGKSWDIVTLTKNDYYQRDKNQKILLNNENGGILFDLYSGESKVTSNGGRTWVNSIKTESSIEDIDFYDESYGSYLSKIGLLYTTNNGGQDWVKSKHIVDGYQQVHHIAESTIVLVQIVMGIYTTHISYDGGTTFSILTGLPIGNPVVEMIFTKNGIGYALGYDGTIYKFDSNTKK